MDTKLKKSSKLAKFIIGLVVVLPAMLLVCLYPRMERVMLQKQEEYANQAVDNTSAVTESSLSGSLGTFVPSGELSIKTNTVNYALEACYYVYGQLLQQAKGTEVNFQVLDRFGWIDDYYTMSGQCKYFAIYQDEMDYVYENTNAGTDFDMILRGMLETHNGTQSIQSILNSDMGIVAVLVMEFDEYGMITGINMELQEGAQYYSSVYAEAKESIDKYQNNANYYVSEEHPEQKDSVMEVLPKNFKIVFAFGEDSSFVQDYRIDIEQWIGYRSNPENLYWEMGAPIVVIILAVFVAFMALILPFFKKLNTGWEPLFSMPLEIICALAVVLVAGIYVMFTCMCHSTFDEISHTVGAIEILGYVLEQETIYGWVLFLNMLGWTACFLGIYTIAVHCRQFVCRPIYYFKNRILIIIFFRWIGRQFKRFGQFMTKVDIAEGLHKTIIKIVLVYCVSAGIMSCFWFVGAIGVVVNSIILYVVLRKEGKKLQSQYYSVLHATRQMAEGELRITLEEDLGVFEPLGEELERVQEGFSKAVAEEAKSQHMKTELISNVSHDLKTPLTAIITYINLLKQEDLSEADRKAYVQTLDMKAQRLKSLIEDLFEVSKAQSGNIQLNLMDVDVVNLMKQLRLEMEDKLADSDLTFRWTLPEEKVILYLDGQKTYRIFENLLSNALKYAMPYSRVYVEVINGEAEVEIIFKNISATEIQADAKQLTERFVRGDASRTTEGSGLGLAIVKSFVELQGGIFKIDIDGDLFKAIILWKKQEDLKKI